MANPAYHIDSPAIRSLHFRQRIPIEGWIFDATSDHGGIAKIIAFSGTEKLGESTIRFPRADVSAALNIPAETSTGFRFLAAFATFPGALVAIGLKAQYHDGHEQLLEMRELRICPDDHLGAPYGHFCDPTYTRILHRRHIYSSGHPSHEASQDCVGLLQAYLPPGGSVFDVGCGVGAYAEPLRKAGLAWTGCEVARECLQELAQKKLPHRRARRSAWLPWLTHRLPARAAEFDAAMAIEVLEHVRRPDRFVAELRRVVRKRALISVPNMEVLPLLSNQLVAPWHILEGDHHNFFNRASLRALLAQYFRHVEVIDYGRFPIQSTDGVSLNYHLFAICDV